MRYFVSTGEASGELAATALAGEIAKIDTRAQFEGIGAGRMRDSGFAMWRDHTGWASLGPLAAIPRIPKLLGVMLATAAHIAREKPDLVILVDFGAFNVRLARRLRAIGYRRPILDLFPPATWLDDPRRAREIAALATPVTAFAHQRDFYASLGLPIEYFGHPLVSRYRMNDPPRPAASDGGTVALLPGSRESELRHHVPLLIAALRELRKTRPLLRGVFGAADNHARRGIEAAIRRAGAAGLEVRSGAEAALGEANAAWVASGTAVLESALCGVPTIAFYVVSAALAWHARRIYRGGFITLPNLVLGREIVPELLQEHATAPKLAAAMDALLANPLAQYDDFAELRAALGPSDALERCAQFAVALAQKGAA